MEGHESHSESGEGNRSRYVTALSSDDVNERNDRVFMPDTIEMARIENEEKGQYVNGIPFSDNLSEEEVQRRLRLLNMGEGEKKYGERVQNLCQKLKQNREEQEELQKRLNALKENERKLKKEIEELNNTQKKADSTTMEADKKSNKWRQKIQELEDRSQDDQQQSEEQPKKSFWGRLKKGKKNASQTVQADTADGNEPKMSDAKAVKHGKKTGCHNDPKEVTQRMEEDLYDPGSGIDSTEENSSDDDRNQEEGVQQQSEEQPKKSFWGRLKKGKKSVQQQSEEQPKKSFWGRLKKGKKNVHQQSEEQPKKSVWKIWKRRKRGKKNERYGRFRDNDNQGGDLADDGESV